MTSPEIEWRDSPHEGAAVLRVEIHFESDGAFQIAHRQVRFERPRIGIISWPLLPKMPAAQRMEARRDA